ncbi:hypothetical protein [Shouchella lonarensis]|uniref:Uncharacterized protein n=1 Tax=Shouchella lonarensis TaxID=1464122 RepID=A0A1G6M7U9_9BACI|nr:hypothetical protein [Shouchella lonarensis]SDC51530.1 hypothetical protein SAMN05421737_109118 [Shouchella lonarensis]
MNTKTKTFPIFFSKYHHGCESVFALAEHIFLAVENKEDYFIDHYDTVARIYPDVRQFVVRERPSTTLILQVDEDDAYMPNMKASFTLLIDQLQHYLEKNENEYICLELYNCYEMTLLDKIFFDVLMKRVLAFGFNLLIKMEENEVLGAV